VFFNPTTFQFQDKDLGNGEGIGLAKEDNGLYPMKLGDTSPHRHVAEAGTTPHQTPTSLPNTVNSYGYISYTKIVFHKI